ncbi:MAG: outer membrane insertion C- signal [Clostridia bacterium]|nr:outer membrane insertion C- signal [Clostridia bacterium]NLS84617.1 outer membrane insertion C- signal [Oscillospiraceae bacterium]
MIPVYLFTGFLDGGKTSFIQETLEDPDFNTGEKTLLLLCEEGEAEYEPQNFAGGNVTILPVENEEDLKPQFFKDYMKKHRVDRVLIEYNGMWKIESLYNAIPNDWKFYQIITVADSRTFPSYLSNMRQLAVDKLQDPEMVLFNHVDDSTDKALLHRSVRMVNRRAGIIFERLDGSIDRDDIVDELPFDKTADVIKIADEDFGLWYLDVLDNIKDYIDKTVEFTAYVCQTDKVPKGCFAAGRFCMTCCAEDITFTGLVCEAKNVAELEHRSWVKVHAKIAERKAEIYEGKGPWLVADSVTPTEQPKDELVYFMN